MKLVTSTALSKDSTVWLYDKSGDYSTKSGYGLGIRNSSAYLNDSTSFDWMKSIWNVHTSQKLKDFLWRVVKQALPVSENLARGGIASFPCAKCGGIEDDLHVFLTCPFTASVWELVPCNSNPTAQSTSMVRWITTAPTLTALPQSGVFMPLWP